MLSRTDERRGDDWDINLEMGLLVTALMLLLCACCAVLCCICRNHRRKTKGKSSVRPPIVSFRDGIVQIEPETEGSSTFYAFVDATDVDSSVQLKQKVEGKCSFGIQADCPTDLMLIARGEKSGMSPSEAVQLPISVRRLAQVKFTLNTINNSLELQTAEDETTISYWFEHGNSDIYMPERRDTPGPIVVLEIDPAQSQTVIHATCSKPGHAPSLPSTFRTTAPHSIGLPSAARSPPPATVLLPTTATSDDSDSRSHSVLPKLRTRRPTPHERQQRASILWLPPNHDVLGSQKRQQRASVVWLPPDHDLSEGYLAVGKPDESSTHAKSAVGTLAED